MKMGEGRGGKMVEDYDGDGDGDGAGDGDGTGDGDGDGEGWWNVVEVFE